jgi:hypothetical protein
MPLPARRPLARSDVETSRIRGMDLGLGLDFGMGMGMEMGMAITASYPRSDDAGSESG